MRDGRGSMHGGGGHACWQGACMVGGMHGGGMHGGRGACMVAGGIHGGGGMHGGRGACVVAGGAYMVVGGMHGGGGGACMVYDEIWSMSGWYASYWNAFLYYIYSIYNKSF